MTVLLGPLLALAGMPAVRATPGCASAPFTDVPADHPFCLEIEWMADEGISGGFLDGSYRPGQLVTRQAISAFMARLAADDDVSEPCITAPFVDVSVEHPFCAEIAWMADERISTGYVDRSFRPGTVVTRQAMAVFMARLAGVPAPTCTSDVFVDVPVGHPFCAEIAWMAVEGISNGYGDGSFRPGAPVTRQAMAALLSRLVLQVPTGTTTTTSTTTSTTTTTSSTTTTTTVPSSPRGPIRRMPNAHDGSDIDGNARYAFISDDGRHVAFESEATNLVAGDTNDRKDVFIWDLDTDTVDLVSRAHDGSVADGVSVDASVSADGRYVAFSSMATNLVPNDENGKVDIFLRDRVMGVTTQVTVGLGGEGTDSHSHVPFISSDGRYIAYTSAATNLVPSDTTEGNDVFLWDRITGATTLVSQLPVGVWGPVVSHDGRYVTYKTLTVAPTSPDIDKANTIFQWDRETGSTKRVSPANDGTQPSYAIAGPSVSRNGRFVVYHSFASNLVPDDTNWTDDVFLWDRDSRATTRVVTSQMSNTSAAIGADGELVAFTAVSRDLVSVDPNEYGHVFVWNRLTGTTQRISVANDGAEPNHGSHRPAVSADGRFVAFTSWASNLVEGDTNDRLEIFVWDRLWDGS